MSEPVSPPIEDADVILCRKIATKTGQPEKESQCVAALKDFNKTADFDKTASTLATILGKTPQEVMLIASEALGPTPLQEKKP
jgi:hypothetical protein